LEEAALRHLGLHVLLDLDGCPRELLEDPVSLRNVLHHAAKKAGATIVGESFHEFNPPGVSGVLLLAESHLSVHTWPESGTAAVDAYSCGGSFDPNLAADVVATQLRARLERRLLVSRGIEHGSARERIA
jgi:S-adenosylmethionine decarboxylase